MTNKKFINLLRRITAKIDKDYIDPSCHYTSFNNGMNILKSHNLQLTEFRSLDDPSRAEIIKGFEVILDTIETFANNEKDPSSITFWEIFLTQFLRLHPDSTNIKPRYKEALSFLDSENHTVSSSYYTFSFSKKFDDKDMWGNFGDKGKGLSIAFKPENFKTANITDSDSLQIYTEAIYDKKEFESRIVTFLKATKNFVNKHRIIDTTIFREMLISLCAQLLPYIPSLLEFENEAEGRLFEFEFKYNNNAPFPRDLSARKFKDANGKDKLDNQNAFNFNDIESIYIGPNCSESESDVREKLRFFKDANGNALYPNADSIKIIKSTLKI